MKLTIENPAIGLLALPNSARRYFDALDWEASEDMLSFQSPTAEKFQKNIADVKNQVVELLSKFDVTIPDSAILLLLHDFMFTRVMEEVMQGHMRQQMERIFPDESERDEAYKTFNMLGSTILS